MSYDECVAARVRQTLAHLPDVTERKMMGSLVFMVNDHMCCGVQDSALTVRIGETACHLAVKKQHVGPMNIGRGRQTKAFIRVEPAGFESKKKLISWVQQGIDFVDSLPPKPTTAKSK